MRDTPFHAGLVMVFFLSCLLPGFAWGQQVGLQLDRPSEREFVVDHADLLSADDVQRIQQVADTLLTETAIPLFVVTINRKADHGGGNLRIGGFAHLLYDQWGIGHEEIDGQPWNKGILLLVSHGDRSARIELGGGFGRQFDQEAQQIMDQQIVPYFQRDDYPGGILAGVEALDRMARGEGVSQLATLQAQAQWWHGLVVIGVIGLFVFTAVSLHRSGRHGWAAVMWIALGGILFMLLRNAARNSGRGRGGGFGGGGFGGGSSGGGGATGRW
ncbi:YgcG family protein [Phycisphaerales bacterium AB-hyl4]|uniref:YgcG family protein n=1 Tax=Natronomicrosphaera hydrolytica TaxID=3242702 RepID=A0ABV4U2T9_9BACT